MFIKVAILYSIKEVLQDFKKYFFFILTLIDLMYFIYNLKLQ